MHYTYWVAVSISLGIGWLLKVLYDNVRSEDKKVFKKLENRSRNFGEDLEYDWILGSEKGNLCFTEEAIQEAAARGEKQKHDLTYTDWE